MTLYECLVVTFEKRGAKLVPLKARREIIDDEDDLGPFIKDSIGGITNPNGMISIIPLQRAEDAPPRKSKRN